MSRSVDLTGTSSIDDECGVGSLQAVVENKISNVSSHAKLNMVQSGENYGIK